MAIRLSHAACFAVILCAASALAAPAMVKVNVAAFDPDKDGTIDLKEAQGAASAAFDKLEADKDGTLDAKELQGRMAEADIKAADPDKDGTIDKKEYLAMVDALFKQADPDNDGTIDHRELSSPPGSALVQLMR